jgi:dephospho-CoA kinase
MLLGIVGLNGAGKDTVARYLVENYGFVHEDFGQEIRNELKVLGKNPLDRNEMVILGNERRTEFGADYWAVRLLKRHVGTKDLVLTSIRNPSEVEAIKGKGGVMVEVFADIKVRYERTVQRVKNDPNSHGDIASFEDFKAKEDRELTSSDPSKQQLLKCISSAEFRLDNNGLETELSPQINNLLKKLKK